MKIAFFGLFIILLTSCVNADEVVRSQYLEMFTGAGRGYPVFSVIEQGEKFTLLKRKFDWIQIKNQEGQLGWVSYTDYAQATGLTTPNMRKQLKKARFELGASYGVLKTDPAYEMSLGYFALPSVMFQMGYKRFTGLYSSSDIIKAQINFQFLRDAVLQPLVYIGGGIMQNAPRELLVNANDENQSVYLVGAGVSWNVYKRMYIKPLVGNYFLSNSKRNLLNFQIMTSAAF